MSDPTGFMKWSREHPHRRPVAERLRDSREVVLPFTPEQATAQSARCMDCGVPFCHQGCPLGNVIPDFNGHVHAGNWRAAYDVLASTNDFPEFTGRLCPAPCEGACVLAIDQGAVTIEEIEKEIIERAFAEGWVVARPPLVRTGKRVAVVGSGPAGLAAAAGLNRAGHEVTVFERDTQPGGLLRYGIPDFKMEKHVIDRRLKLLEAEGVRFRCGESADWEKLRATHDALVIAIGARKARALELPLLPGVVQAMDYLTGKTESAAGKRVIILGGGDTGSDVLGTAHRQGAASIAQVELLAAPPLERAATNPWPQWPVIFRTSSSQEEGGDRLFARKTVRLEGGPDGRLCALHWVGVDRALEALPGTEERREVDLLVQAMGFTGPDERPLDVALDKRGNLAVDAHFMTSQPGVFCAGDAMRGASLIVWAISDGRELARHCDAWLMQRPALLPTRGRNADFSPARPR
jgi:glutamate synthase (NADPH/NADH) small chain